ncbi:MAG: hypothetical protein LBG06_00630 [Deltaproteobacteria bacterium]|jgi:hypothetical protein|nr:hypothetical protein [Deltaproteobacteria bacterium]
MSNHNWKTDGDEALRAVQTAQNLLGTFNQELLDRLADFTEALEGKWIYGVGAFNSIETTNPEDLPFGSAPWDSNGFAYLPLCDTHLIITSRRLMAKGFRKERCIPGAWLMAIFLATNKGIIGFWDSHDAVEALPHGKAWLRIHLYKVIEASRPSTAGKAKEPGILVETWEGLTDDFPEEPGWSKTSSPSFMCYTCDVDFVRFMADSKSVAGELKPLLAEGYVIP